MFPWYYMHNNMFKYFITQLSITCWKNIKIFMKYCLMYPVVYYCSSASGTALTGVKFSLTDANILYTSSINGIIRLVQLNLFKKNKTSIVSMYSHWLVEHRKGSNLNCKSYDKIFSSNPQFNGPRQSWNTVGQLTRPGN